jgi:hypothetical protein
MPEPARAPAAVQDYDDTTCFLHAFKGLVVIGFDARERRLHAEAREQFARAWTEACAQAGAWTEAHPEEAEDGR